MKLKSNRDYLVLLLAAVLTVIFIILAIIITIGEVKSPGKPQAPPQTNTVESVKYKAGSLGKAFDKLTNRVPLSTSDQIAKNKLISQAGKSGIIKKTESYSIEYVAPMDDFEIEILSTNIEAVKKEAESYLKSQGFSKEGLCDLPVRFYLNFNVRSSLPQGTVFNPLTEGC